MDERQKRDEEVKVPHARSKGSRLTKARARAFESKSFNESACKCSDGCAYKRFEGNSCKCSVEELSRRNNKNCADRIKRDADI